MTRLCKLFLIVSASMLLLISLLQTSARPAVSASLGMPVTPGAVSVLCFPYTPNTPGGTSTTLYLTNVGTAVANLMVQSYAEDGAAIQSGFAATVQTGGTVAPLLADLLNPRQGTFQTVVSADGPVEGVAHVRDSVTGVVGVYRGVPCSGGADLWFGPFYGGNMPNASIAVRLMNSGAQTATLQAVFLEANGSAVYTQTNISVPPNGGALLSNATLPAGVTLPMETIAVRVTHSAADITGIMVTTLFGVTSLDGPLASRDAGMAGLQPMVSWQSAIPRLYVREDIGGTSFSSQLLATSLSAEANVFSMNFFRADGAQGAAPLTQMLPPFGSWVLNTRNSPNLPGGIHSVVTGSQAELVTEAKVYPENVQQAGYGVDSVVVQPASASLLVPGVVHNNDAFTILAVQNMGAAAASVTVQLRDQAGLPVKIVTGQLPAGAALSIDLRDPNGLPLGFFGSALVTSNQPVVAQVDMFSRRIDNIPITNISISGPGPFPIRPNFEIQLLAVASPMTVTKPITYTWQVEDLPDIVHVTDDYQDAAPLSWQTSGAKTVRVTAANALGEVTTATEILVASPPASITVSGPAVGLPEQLLQFTAAVSPTYAATPITYTWRTAGMPDTVNVNYSLTDQASFTWTMAGTKIITLTAANELGSATAHFTLTVPAAAAPTTSEPFTLTLGEASGPGVTLSVPAGAARAGYTLTANPISVQQLISTTEPPEGVTILGAAVQIEAFAGDGQPVENFVFDRPATLFLRYSDAEAGANESNLRIYTVANGQWQDAAETCDPPSTYVRRPAQNEVEVAICHLSPYVLAKEAGNSLYLPDISK